MPSDVSPALRMVEDVIAGKLQAVTFTAGPAIRNLMAIAAERDLDDALRHALTSGRTVVGCVGPVCAEAAAQQGIASPHLVMPRTWRLGPLVRAVAERLVERTLTVDLRGSTMTISGNLVTVDDESVVLTDTEARVLTVLASEPNHVYAKVDLLRQVWRDEDADPHVVEAVVNRLRRRLGPSGRSISAVYRRGYTLRV
jgi:uroporphyrinogen-III synthase